MKVGPRFLQFYACGEGDVPDWNALAAKLNELLATDAPVHSAAYPCATKQPADAAAHDWSAVTCPRCLHRRWDNAEVTLRHLLGLTNEPLPSMGEIIAELRRVYVEPSLRRPPE